MSHKEDTSATHAKPGKEDLRNRVRKVRCRESSALRVEPKSQNLGLGRGLEHGRGRWAGGGVGIPQHMRIAAGRAP